uniref:Rho-GAP domain-containing protein n=1 Tax=Myotis lucifugus TaxID=59463 RepID=G1QC45_MYOLU
MLFFINQKGLPTEGIFRKSADLDSCRVLKDKLNSGRKVKLDSEYVLVAACVLKDFLRNIPGSIFSPDVYEEWLSVMDEENEEEKITASQRLLELLPRANIVLLRHLFGLLHSIQQHSFTNHMTAGNLGVCLTPSILCLPIPCTSDLRKDLRKKFDLAQFLIQNGLKIFRKDITSLCVQSPMTGENS